MSTSLMLLSAGGALIFLIWLAVIVLYIAGMWKTFAKAGRPGWAAIIPFYNVYVATEVARLSILWFILALLIPIVGMLVVSIKIAENFGKGAGFGIGLFLLPMIFYPILGFGQAQYQGTAGIAGGSCSCCAPPPQQGQPPAPPAR
jgi:hypothetical protein